MRRLALAVTLGSLALLATSAAVLAAYRVDDGIMRGATRGTAMVVWAGGTNARLVFINEAVAPDTYSVAPIDDEWATLRFAFSATGDASSATGARRADHVERLLL